MRWHGHSTTSCAQVGWTPHHCVPTDTTYRRPAAPAARGAGTLHRPPLDRGICATRRGSGRRARGATSYQVHHSNTTPVKQVAATKDLVRARFLSMLYEKQACFQLHVVVGACNTGAVAAAIIEEAEVLDAAVVVLGSHLKSLLQELWSGSVANTVAARLRRPCVLVR